MRNRCKIQIYKKMGQIFLISANISPHPDIKTGKLSDFSDPGIITQTLLKLTGPRSAVGNVSGYRCVSDCRSRGREFDPGPVPYFCED